MTTKQSTRKRFLIKVRHTEGEHEYTHYGVMVGDTSEQVWSRALKAAVEWFAFPDEEERGDTEYSIRVKGCQEITIDNALVLLQLGVATDMDDDASLYKG